MKKSSRSKAAAQRRLADQLRTLPRDLFSKRIERRRSARRLLALTICLTVMLVSAGLIFFRLADRAAIERNNESYRALYSPYKSSTAAPMAVTEHTSAPAVTQAPTPTVAPTAEATAAPSAHSTVTRPITRAPLITDAPAPDIAATPAAEITPAPCVTDAPAPAPLSTADADTRVFALETVPPIQESFAALLAENAETVGYLAIGDIVSLPVAQRVNDNDYYLTHNFSGEESNAGTLFLDGANLLTPEDQELIVYGHNMKNGTMFAPLSNYKALAFLRQSPLIHFDTIYDNRVYVPFAVLSVSAGSGDSAYLDFRRFVFDDGEAAQFSERLRAASLFDIPVDVRADDQLLLLVTCEYTQADGRLLLAARRLRTGESETDALAALAAAGEK